MKKQYKILIISFIVVALLAIAVFGAIIGSGNDGYAQKYAFNVSYTALFKTVKNLKNGSSAFNPPPAIYDPDSLDSSRSRFIAEIYSQKGNTTFGFFIEPAYNKPNKSFIYLVSINQGFDFRNWKIVNRDLNKDENLNVKKRFEQEILDKLNLKYENEGNGMFIFWK